MSTHTATDFPVPADMASGFWQWDKMHFPRPLTPLSQDLTIDLLCQGFSQAMDEFGCPFGASGQAVNYYGYLALSPFDPPGNPDPTRNERYNRTMKEVLPRMGELWDREWLPSILPGLKKAQKTDYAALSDQALVSTIKEMAGELRNRYVVHGRINFVMVTASMFADFYNENFHPEDPTEPYAALQGFPTRSLDAGRGLWRLGRQIKRSEVLCRAFSQAETSAIIDELKKSSEGVAFLKEFRSYLDEFGWRSDVFDISDPTWREDPRIPLNALQGYMLLGDDEDPDVRHGRAVQRREQLLEAARAKLRGDAAKLARFQELYEMARHYLTITEDHNFYIDQVGMTVMRLPALEAGRRLTIKGRFNVPEDIFFLHLNEIPAAFDGAAVRETVEKRRQEIAKWSKIIPVPTIGEPPPQDGPSDPFLESIGRFMGNPVEPSRDTNVIKGIGASQGTTQGTAKVVRSLSEASKLRKGDILVCEMTMPPWTPLFSTVSGLVADTGGVLSHCAIVSREYRLPAVVGTQVGTSLIKDGMLLTVDGSKGIVRIDSRY